jgi:hypothetical protein
MPTADLCTWLVRAGQLTAERVDEVYKHQVIYGGSLDTAILEKGLLSEETLLNLLGESLRLPVAQREDVLGATGEAAKALPKKLAQKYAMVPLRLSDRELCVAAAYPVPQSTLDGMGLMLGVEFKLHAALELRVQQGLLRVYGVPLAARTEQLLAQLGEDPELNHRDGAAPVPRETLSTAEIPSAEAWVAFEPARAIPRLAPLVPAEGPSAPLPAPVRADDAAALGTAELAGDTSVALGGLLGNLVHGVADSAAADGDELLTRMKRRQEKVSWRLTDARAEFALAESRDDIVEIILRFAYKTMDFAAVFIRQGGEFVGWDCIGEGYAPRAISRVRIRPEAGSALALLEGTGSHYLGPLKPSDPLPAAVGRAHPRVALLCPFNVQGRLIGVLYGERGNRPLPPRTVAGLQALTHDLGRALEGLILRQKRRRLGLSDGLGTRLSAKRTSLPPVLPAGPSPGERTGLTGVSSSAQRAYFNLAGPAPPLQDSVALHLPPLGAGASPTVSLPHAAPADWGIWTVQAVAPRVMPPPLPPVSLPPFQGQDDGEVRAQADALLREAAGADAPTLQRLAEALLRLPVNQELQELLGQAFSRSPSANAAVQRLVVTRGWATAHVLRALPGPLLVNVFSNDGSRTDVAEISPVGRVLMRLGPTSCALAVAACCQHPEREARLLAVLMARGTRMAAMPEFLAGRVFDPEPRIAYVAAGVLDSMLLLKDERADAARRSLGLIRQQLQQGGVEAKRAAARAASQIHEASLVGPLVEMVAGKDRELAHLARVALTEITKQDFGDSVRRWRKWLEENQSRRRMEWLLDGLGHKERTLRQSAHRELSQLTGEYLGYFYDAPVRERQSATERWRLWWDANRSRVDLP